MKTDASQEQQADQTYHQQNHANRQPHEQLMLQGQGNQVFNTENSGALEVKKEPGEKEDPSREDGKTRDGAFINAP